MNIIINKLDNAGRKFLLIIFLLLTNYYPNAFEYLSLI